MEQENNNLKKEEVKSPEEMLRDLRGLKDKMSGIQEYLANLHKELDSEEELDTVCEEAVYEEEFDYNEDDSFDAGYSENESKLFLIGKVCSQLESLDKVIIPGSFMNEKQEIVGKILELYIELLEDM